MAVDDADTCSRGQFRVSLLFGVMVEFALFQPNLSAETILFLLNTKIFFQTAGSGENDRMEERTTCQLFDI